MFLYAPSVSVATGAAVSAAGGASGLRGAGGSGGAGGLGRIRVSATAGTCTLGGTFAPALVSGCTVTPAPGADGRTYVSAFPL